MVGIFVFFLWLKWWQENIQHEKMCCVIQVATNISVIYLKWANECSIEYIFFFHQIINKHFSILTFIFFFSFLILSTFCLFPTTWCCILISTRNDIDDDDIKKGYLCSTQIHQDIWNGNWELLHFLCPFFFLFSIKHDNYEFSAVNCVSHTRSNERRLDYMYFWK